jgi:hypothetical protein
MISPCNSSVKNYTEIFSTFYEGNVLSFQCKMILERFPSVCGVDGLSLILIDPYVPVLTSRLHCSEAALQVSGNIALFEVCCIYIYIYVSSAKSAK